MSERRKSPEFSEDYERQAQFQRRRGDRGAEPAHTWKSVPCTRDGCDRMATIRDDEHPATAECLKCWCD